MNTPLVGESRSCMTCLHRFDVSLLYPAGPGLWACLDQPACWARQDALGPQAESAAGIELVISRHEAAQGVPTLPPDRGAADIRPRTGKLITTGVA